LEFLKIYQRRIEEERRRQEEMMMFKKQQEGMRGGAGPMNGGNNMSILNTNGPQQFDPTMINQVWIFKFKIFFN